eukprot:12901112-Prorocentrum_lima.AAC.1
MERMTWQTKAALIKTNAWRKWKSLREYERQCCCGLVLKPEQNMLKDTDTLADLVCEKVEL